MKPMTRKTRWIGLTIGLVALIAAGALAVSRIMASDTVALDTQVIERGDIEKVVLATGVIKPSVQVNVGAQVNGQLRKLYVRAGDKVKKGQLLAEIDPTLQESDLNNAKAQLASAQAQRMSSKATLVRYRQELARQRMMARDGSGVRSDLEQAQAQYDSQVQQVKMYEAQIVQSQMAVKTAMANLGYTRIVAPVDGEVLGIITQEGQTIVSSQTAPTILVLADLDKMIVQTRISEADVGKIRPGQPLWFYAVANPQKRYESEMGFVQPAPQEALEEQRGMYAKGPGQNSAVYYNGTFEIANPDRELKTSMTAQVYIRVAQVKNVLRVPVAALGQAFSADHYQVLVMENGKAQPRKVHIGLNDRQFAEVLEGLKDGDRVVMQPTVGQG
ncbi:efflux RND transporter periplasmic adaptor subunit [Enterobacterales bacterium BIT-L3]|jgi:macrolide-specific efflux system membrane fusion protein|uniref:Efflux RND transporter periplasmic adaptor subunit n=2 Tax=Tenebrionibacter intestinalis TaxID=2799638 RepID=A0A8K0V199_9ENTR|nr:efflux RND transporter periplasmic adaptor subunit [Tenebrionibacter intestinalis]MBK4715088.1 efflux RND transporter periplasmic adaptor subunit [Tenebrionibacter intestinalis]